MKKMHATPPQLSYFDYSGQQLSSSSPNFNFSNPTSPNLLR